MTRNPFTFQGCLNINIITSMAFPPNKGDVIFTNQRVKVGHMSTHKLHRPPNQQLHIHFKFNYLGRMLETRGSVPCIPFLPLCDFRAFFPFSQEVEGTSSKGAAEGTPSRGKIEEISSRGSAISLIWFGRKNLQLLKN